VRRFLFLLVLLLPLADVYLLVVIARHIGTWPVLAFVLASAMLGGRLARSEGRRVLGDLQTARREGAQPREGLLSAGLLAVAGVLLVLPGVMSTLAGLALLMPPVRRLIGRAARGWVETRMAAFAVDPRAGASPGDAHPHEAPSLEGGRVIDIDDRGRPLN
jgi:UPF0716 protein FxsA